MPNNNIVTSLKNTIKYPLKLGYNLMMDIRSAYYLCKVRNKRPSGKIKVGFIVQMSEIWDKEVGIYEDMLSREEFEPIIIVVPPYNMSTKKYSISYKNNYFIKNYPNAVKAISKDGTVIDIASMDLDYVFYQRPYDHYLVPKLRSSELVKYTRCCYVPYGYSGSDIFNDLCTHRSFMRNMSYAFFESQYISDITNNKLKNTLPHRFQDITFMGYPVLESFFGLANDKDTDTKVKNVLWTPRWSYDKKTGGSHFIEYKDLFLELAGQYPDVEFVFRPHPLMFEELEREGLFSSDEKNRYLSQLNECGAKFDTDSLFIDAAEKADVLITDYSSILINFFVSGKPIIYCDSMIEFNSDFKKMDPGIYHTASAGQIKECIGKLYNGCDTLKEKRHRIREEMFKAHKDSSARIADLLESSVKKQ